MIDLYEVPLELTHHGVKGMKWGVRKSNVKTSLKKKSKKIVSAINKLDKYEKQYQKYGSVVGKGLKAKATADAITLGMSVTSGKDMFAARKGATAIAKYKTKRMITRGVNKSVDATKSSYKEFDIARKQKKGGIATHRPKNASNVTINNDIIRR